MERLRMVVVWSVGVGGENKKNRRDTGEISGFYNSEVHALLGGVIGNGVDSLFR